MLFDRRGKPDWFCPLPLWFQWSEKCGDFAVVIFGVGFENQFYVFVLFDERFDGTGGFLTIGA